VGRLPVAPTINIKVVEWLEQGAQHTAPLRSTGISDFSNGRLYLRDIRLWEAIIKINRSEYFSCFSHLAGAVAALAGTVFLVIHSWGHADLVIVSLIYGLAMIWMFTGSTLYHAAKKAENAVNIWRKLDHIAIFFMIAGSYTPLCYVYLDGAWRVSILSIAWFFVIVGILLKVFFLKAPRILSPLLYLMMGWLAVIPLRELWQNMPHFSFFLLLAGGVAYSIGAVIYAIKKPTFFPGIFGFHEIFHLLILAGAVLHYILVFMTITAAAL
jgi:hemolysin III